MLRSTPNYCKKIFLLFFFTWYKTGGKEIDFKDKKIYKKDFYKNKKLFRINYIDINKILFSEPESYGKKNAKKYIIGYSDDVIRPLWIMLPQMISFVNCFDNNKTMSFLADDEELLKEYTKVWKKIINFIVKKFDSEPPFGDKYIKTKIKSYKNNINTNFRSKKNSKKVPQEGRPYKCFPLIALDSVIVTGKKYYPQTFLEECRYKLTKKKTEDLIVDDFDSSSESDGESGSE